MKAYISTHPYALCYDDDIHENMQLEKYSGNEHFHSHSVDWKKLCAPEPDGAKSKIGKTCAEGPAAVSPT